MRLFLSEQRYSFGVGALSITPVLQASLLSKKQQTSYWGNFEISEKQKEYAASDVLHLHRLKEKLDQMLKRENRTEIFAACLKFLPARVKLDLQGFSNVDIFAHN